MTRQALDGWNQIGHYLGVTGRTAQNWEKTSELPVRRMPGGNKPRVFAYTDELDEWRTKTNSQSEQSPPTAARSRTKRTWLIAATLAILFTVAIWQMTTPGPPAMWRVSGTTLEVLDSEGRQCWAKSFPDLFSESYREPYSTRHGLMTDIDSNGQEELLFSYLPQGVRETAGGILIRYEIDGAEKWRLNYNTAKKYGERELAPFYETRILDTIRTLGKLHILLITYHRNFPTRVLLLDPNDGRIVEEYWHPGHLSTHLKLNLDSDDDDELILGGSNNPGHGPGHPAFLILDFPLNDPPKNLPSYFPVEFTGSGEAGYYLLPLPPIGEALQLVFAVTDIQPVGGQFKFRVGSGPYRQIEYHLNQDFGVVGVWPNDRYTEEVRKLELDGTLKPTDPTQLERVLSFPTAPDGNHPAIKKLFQEAAQRQQPTN